MSMKHKFRKLKLILEEKSYQKNWYRIENFMNIWYTTYETFWCEKKINFIMKRLWCVQIWKHCFLQTMCSDWEIDSDLAGLYYEKHHKEKRWLYRTREKKENQIKLKNNREHRELMRDNSRKIEIYHTIFYRKR